MHLENFISGKENNINTLYQQPLIEKEKMLSLYKDSNSVNLDISADYIKKPRIDKVTLINEDNQQDQLLFEYEDGSGYESKLIDLPIGYENIEISANESENKLIFTGTKNNKIDSEIILNENLYKLDNINIIVDYDGTIYFNHPSGYIETRYITKINGSSLRNKNGDAKELNITSKKSVDRKDYYSTSLVTNYMYHLDAKYLNNILLVLLSNANQRTDKYNLKVINNFSWYGCLLENYGNIYSSYRSEYYQDWCIWSQGTIRKISDDVIIPTSLYGFPITYIGDLDFEQKEIKNLTIPREIDMANFTTKTPRIDGAFHNLKIDTVIFPHLSLNLDTLSFVDCTINNLQFNDNLSTLSIGTEAFKSCDGDFLKDIPWNKATFSQYPFRYCTFKEINNEDIANLNGEYIFGECYALSSINLPNLTTIPKGIFYYCRDLDSNAITLSSELTNIKDYAFYLCTSLKSLDFLQSNNNITLGNYVFGKCSNLIDIVLPSAVKTMGDYTFDSCTGLKSINLSQVTSIGRNTFTGCTVLETVNAPELTTMGTYNFAALSTLKSVDLLKINKISDYSFNGCTNLTSILAPNVTSLGFSAFRSCSSLTDIDFPKAVSISSECFENCSGLNNVNLPLVTTLSSYAFNNCGTIETLNLPLITSIPSYCFTSTYVKNANFNSLTSVTNLPSLTTFEVLNIPKVSSINSFSNKTNLKEIDISNVSSIPTSCFEGCTNLSLVKLGNNLTTIYQRSFYNCQKLNNINTPEVTTIGNQAFYKCNTLTEMILPKVSLIPLNCFEECANLVNISALLATTVQDYAFNKCAALKNVDLPLVTSLGIWSFANCASLEEINLPSLLSLGNYAFANCKALTSIALPMVTSLGQNGLSACSSLQEINLPKVESIGATCFTQCTSLTKILIPNVNSLGIKAFYNCTALEILDIANFTGSFPSTTAFSDTTYSNFKEITNSKLTSMSGITVANDFSLSNNQGLLSNFTLFSTGKVVINSLINTTSTTISLAKATDITINNLNEEDALGTVNLTLNVNATALDIKLKGLEPETMAAMMTSNCKELRNYNYWTPLYLKSSTMVPFLSTGIYATPTATETYIELGEVNEEGYMTGSIYTKYKNKVFYIPSTLEAEYLTQEYFSNLVPDVQHGYFTTQDTETGEWTDFVLVSTEKSTVKEDYGFGIITV